MISTLNYLQRFYLLDLLMSEDYVNFQANWSSYLELLGRKLKWYFKEWHLHQDMFVKLLIKFENSMSKFIKYFWIFQKILYFSSQNFSLRKCFFLKMTTLYLCVCVCVCVCIKGVWRYYRMFVNVDIISMRKSHHTGAICTGLLGIEDVKLHCRWSKHAMCVYFLICFYVEYVW
jgi:hypothetical protein